MQSGTYNTTETQASLGLYVPQCYAQSCPVFWFPCQPLSHLTVSAGSPIVLHVSSDSRCHDPGHVLPYTILYEVEIPKVKLDLRSQFYNCLSMVSEHGQQLRLIRNSCHPLRRRHAPRRPSPCFVMQRQENVSGGVHFSLHSS